MAVGNLVKQLQDIMRKDAGISGDAQRIEQMVWVIFLKVYDAMEEDWELDDVGYESIIPEQLRWRNWAHSKDADGKVIKSLSTDELLKFVNDKLFPVLKGQDFGEKPKEKGGVEKKEEDNKKEYIPGIKVTRDTPRHQAIVYDVFREVNQYMKDGSLLRQLIDKIDEVDLYDSEEAHTFGNIYEGILKDLQAAGNAGEFYTPRAVTDFIIQMLDPQLGEKVGDFAMGTGGFLVSALNHMKSQIKYNEDIEKWQNSIIGQEWKPFPYLLAVTNVLLHEIKDPQLYHMDSLGCSMSDYEEEGKVNVIAMNPPYGGATSSTTKLNFKAEYRSSETADLFMVLIMQRLAEDGRAGVIVPDGFLFGTDGAKLAIKRRLLKEFNLHTIVRLPGSVFSPYTGIATNILFFNNERADDAPEGFNTAKTWFYRLDKPEGYINFSKTKPMLLSHFDEVCEWWNNRRTLDDGEKSQCFTPEEIEIGSYNLDLCKYPKEEEVILRPDELMKSYLDRSEECHRQIIGVLSNLQSNLNGKANRVEIEKPIDNPWKELAEITASLPDKLKKSILQEAIMGKLGTLDPNDEPAFVLLDKIRAEKKRLMKEGKLKEKELDVVPLEEEKYPYEIPDSWKWVRLEDITIYISRGKSPTYSEIKKYPIVAQKCNQWSGFSLEKAKFADPKTIDKYAEERLLQDGDLLWNSTGIGTLGRMAIYDSNVNEYGWAVADSHVTVIRTRPDFAYYKYLYYYFASPEVQSVIEDKSDGSTKQKELSQETVRKYEVPLPPLAEQHRIVQKIEELYAEIDNMTSNNIIINETEEIEKD